MQENHSFSPILFLLIVLSSDWFSTSNLRAIQSVVDPTLPMLLGNLRKCYPLILCMHRFVHILMKRNWKPQTSRKNYKNDVPFQNKGNMFRILSAGNVGAMSVLGMNLAETDLLGRTIRKTLRTLYTGIPYVYIYISLYITSNPTKGSLPSFTPKKSEKAWKKNHNG